MSPRIPAGYCLKTSGGPLTRFPLRDTVTSLVLVIGRLLHLLQRLVKAEASRFGPRRILRFASLSALEPEF